MADQSSYDKETKMVVITKTFEEKRSFSDLLRQKENTESQIKQCQERLKELDSQIALFP